VASKEAMVEPSEKRAAYVRMQGEHAQRLRVHMVEVSHAQGLSAAVLMERAQLWWAI